VLCVAVGMMRLAEESNPWPLILCESKELFTVRNKPADGAGKIMENPKKVIYELFKKIAVSSQDACSCIQLRVCSK
jgi:hypothetical protein